MYEVRETGKRPARALTRNRLGVCATKYEQIAFMHLPTESTLRSSESGRQRET
jgi:hypothetical protein